MTKGKFVIGPHWWLLLPIIALLLGLFVIPLGYVLEFSFLRYAGAGQVEHVFTWENYGQFLKDPYYRGILFRTLWIALAVTVINLLLGYPLAYSLARSRSRWRTVLRTFVIFPLLTSAVVRTFGWILLLGNNGVMNSLLMGMGLTQEPIRFLYRPMGVVIGMSQVLLPFMVLSLESAIRNIDSALEEASGNLGAPPWRTFWHVSLPLSLPGILAGSLLVFALCISSFVTPAMMGGVQSMVMATLIYHSAVGTVNWPFASASSLILLAVTTVLISLYYRTLQSSNVKL